MPMRIGSYKLSRHSLAFGGEGGGAMVIVASLSPVCPSDAVIGLI